MEKRCQYIVNCHALRGDGADNLSYCVHGLEVCGSASQRGAQERIIGQTEAVRALARAMWRARTGLKDPRRPIAAVLFAGGTGVGKTETTKACPPGWVFGSEGFCLRGRRQHRQDCQDRLHSLEV